MITFRLSCRPPHIVGRSTCQPCIGSRSSAAKKLVFLNYYSALFLFLHLPCQRLKKELKKRKKKTKKDKKAPRRFRQEACESIPAVFILESALCKKGLLQRLTGLIMAAADCMNGEAKQTPEMDPFLMPMQFREISSYGANLC